MSDANVFVVCRIVGDGARFEISGVFSTREAAAAICKSDESAVVGFELDRDCSDERTFEIWHPTLDAAPEMVTV